MSAEVNEIVRFQAYCSDCRWQGPETESVDAADLDADEHDDECHGEQS